MIKENEFSDKNISDKIRKEDIQEDIIYYNKNISLDEAFKELESVAFQLSDTLDVSSEKITKIENRLRVLRTNLPYQMCVFKQESPYKPLEAYHFNGGPTFVKDSGYHTKTECFLSWSVCDQAKSFRIIVSAIEIDLGFGYFTENEFTDSIELTRRTIYNKPLIECKLEIRLQLAKFIIPFIRSFTDYLKSYSSSIASYSKFTPETFAIDDLFKREKNKEKDSAVREKSLAMDVPKSVADDLPF